MHGCRTPHRVGGTSGPWTPARPGRYAPAVHSDLASTLADSRSATTRWLALVEPLSSTQANWRPAPDRWSIAQVLDHLAATTGPLAPVLLEAGAKARSAGRFSDGPFRYGPLARWLLRSLAPAGARPLPARGPSPRRSSIGPRPRRSTSPR